MFIGAGDDFGFLALLLGKCDMMFLGRHRGFLRIEYRMRRAYLKIMPAFYREGLLVILLLGRTVSPVGSLLVGIQTAVLGPRIVADSKRATVHEEGLGGCAFASKSRSACQS